MEQRSLRVVESNKTFFSKITNTISKMLVPTRVGINGIMISIKRNSLLKAYNNYVLEKDLEEQKKEQALQKYEESFALYLEAIDKHIIDSVYKKVKNGTASNFEKEALSKYYLVVSLKDKNYLEYKYKKQEYLLKVDYENASSMKKESFLEKYKDFYIFKMDMLYKGLLKNYSIELASDYKYESENIYNKIFNTLETYVIDILPIKIEKNKDNKELIEEYDKYENTTVGKLDERDKIIQKLILLGISRRFFTHSLPLTATEKCYIKLIMNCREVILKASNDIKREKAYKTFIEVIEDYNKKLLSTRVYWDKLEEREKYKKFWDKYSNTDDAKAKEILILKYDIKKLNKNEEKYSQIIKIHKNRLVKLGGMQEVKNECKTYNNYKGKKILTKKIG